MKEVLFLFGQIMQEIRIEEIGEGVSENVLFGQFDKPREMVVTEHDASAFVQGDHEEIHGSVLGGSRFYCFLLGETGNQADEKASAPAVFPRPGFNLFHNGVAHSQPPFDLDGGVRCFRVQGTVGAGQGGPVQQFVAAAG